MEKFFYRVIFSDKYGDMFACFYKAFSLIDVVKYIDKSEPFHVVEVKEYKTMPKKYEGERVDPNTITEI